MTTRSALANVESGVAAELERDLARFELAGFRQ